MVEQPPLPRRRTLGSTPGANAGCRMVARSSAASSFSAAAAALAASFAASALTWSPLLTPLDFSTTDLAFICTDATNACTFFDLDLFFNPKVLSSTLWWWEVVVGWGECVSAYAKASWAGAVPPSTVNAHFRHLGVIALLVFAHPVWVCFEGGTARCGEKPGLQDGAVSAWRAGESPGAARAARLTAARRGGGVVRAPCVLGEQHGRFSFDCFEVFLVLFCFACAHAPQVCNARQCSTAV